MPDTTTGAFVDYDDANMEWGTSYFEIKLDLIREYIDNQPSANALRIYSGTYSGTPTRIAVLMENSDMKYYTGAGATQVLEHIGSPPEG